ncbi:MAG: RDD family protein [Sphingopyxis sp.]
MSGVPIASSAAGATRYAHARKNKLRSFVTPEGVDLQLQIAGSSQRFGALMLDLIFMVLILIAGSILLAMSAFASLDAAAIIWLLGFFLLRNFWFLLFELGPRAATPGKRIVGIRVVARDGGRLTVAAVTARNLVREIEIFLPFTFLIGLLSVPSGDAVEAGSVILGIVWTAGLGFFLLFNKDRMRLGDLIGGTWVVVARRKRIAADIASAQIAQTPGAPVFSPQELAVYGIFELQELERVLRQGDRDTMIAVADTIRAKIGRTLQEDDKLFLVSYYRQLKARQERDLLFGKRRENKYEAQA